MHRCIEELYQSKTLHLCLFASLPLEWRFIMSKGSGMGRKRVGARINKGMDKCDVASHGKQCGRPKDVSKGKHLKTKSGIF